MSFIGEVIEIFSIPGLLLTVVLEGLLPILSILYLLIGFYFAWEMAEHPDMMILVNPSVDQRTVYLVNCPIVIFGWPAMVVAAHMGSK